MARREQGRRQLLPFVTYTKPDYNTNWHHQVIAEHLDKIASGELLRLMIFCPPGSGKSELVSRRLPAHILGRDPSLRVISASYNASLAERMGRDVQRIMTEQEYRRVFPGTKIGSQHEGFKRTSVEFETTARGSYKAVGIGQGLGGFRFDVGLIDDPVKDRKESLSQSYRDSVWEWYTSVFLNRQAVIGGCPIVLLMTRWHEDDLAGRILNDAAGGGEQWTVLRFPAIREEDSDNPYPVEVAPVDPREVGEPLWAAQAPLEALKLMMRHALDWSSLHQQRPAPAEGSLLKRDWFRYFMLKDLRNVRYVEYVTPSAVLMRVPFTSLVRFATIDLARTEPKGGNRRGSGRKTDPDYTVCASWGVSPDGSLFLLDVRRGQMEGPKILPTVAEACLVWGLHTAWFESVAFQGVMVQFARELGIPARELTRSRWDAKEARAWAASVELAAGKVYWLAGAPWLSVWESELLAFGAGAAHDDQVDTFSDAVLVMKKEAIVAPEPPQVAELPPRDRDNTLASLPRGGAPQYHDDPRRHHEEDDDG